MSSNIILAIVAIGIILFLAFPTQVQGFIDNITNKNITIQINSSNPSSCTPNWGCTSWSTCSGNTQSRTCQDTNKCATTLNMPTTSQSCNNPGTNPTSLDAYLQENPKIKYWIDSYDSETKSYFLKYLSNLENNGKTGLEKPDITTTLAFILRHDSYGDTLTTSQQTQLNKLVAAKAAHAVWLDKNSIVPWKLSFYSKEELGSLFDKEAYMAHQWDGLYLDWSPDVDFDYSKNYITSSKEQTLNNLLESLESFRHVSMGDSSASETTIQGALNDKIAQGGCHGMSQVVSALSDSLNIVTSSSHKGWIGAGHAGVTFFEIGVLLHGDNIYNGALIDVPGIKKLAPWSYFKQYIEPAGVGGLSDDGHGQINYYSLRYDALQTLAYPPAATRILCCSGTRDSCINQLSLCYGYVIPAGSPTCGLTNQEFDQLYTKLKAMC